MPPSPIQQEAASRFHNVVLACVFPSFSFSLIATCLARSSTFACNAAIVFDTIAMTGPPPDVNGLLRVKAGFCGSSSNYGIAH